MAILISNIAGVSLGQAHIFHGMTAHHKTRQTDMAQSRFVIQMRSWRPTHPYMLRTPISHTLPPLPYHAHISLSQ